MECLQREVKEATAAVAKEYKEGSLAAEAQLDANGTST